MSIGGPGGGTDNIKGSEEGTKKRCSNGTV